MSYLKAFLAGEKGYSHVAEEFGALVAVSSALGWLISPAVNVVFAVLVWSIHKKVKVPFIGDKYWISREVSQSKAMGRVPSGDDKTTVPIIPNRFWTKDAIAGVEFPRKLRPLLLIAVLAYSFFIYTRVGL